MNELINKPIKKQDEIEIIKTFEEIDNDALYLIKGGDDKPSCCYIQFSCNERGQNE